MAETAPPVPFSSLPLTTHHAHTKLNAWTLYGSADELGFLNRQTDAIIAAAAASELKTGTRVSLNAALDFQGSKVMFSRQTFHKEVYQKKPRIVHDDTWTFNTQSSSQWDGLRHFGYQKAERFYNDVTLGDIAGTSGSGKPKDVLGIQNAAERGIVGRGILVDFQRWREGPGKEVVEKEGGYEPFKTSALKLEWLKETLRWQGTEVRYGDILVVRSGYMKGYHQLDDAAIDGLVAQSPPGLGGVEQSDEALQWIWENFSAVAGDQPGFERWPTPYDWSMHEVLLAGWGCPIGELFELEELSKECEKHKRWSFFMCSEPTNVPGGVASPPNVLAIF
jgi:hypothetical protein